MSGVAVAEWLTTDLGDGGTYPFAEDENCNITGHGHQEPSDFADAVNRYDEYCNGKPFPADEQWDASHIAHQWGVLTADESGGEVLQRVPSGTPGAVPITTLWGER